MKYALSVRFIWIFARRMMPVRPMPATVAQNSEPSSSSGAVRS